MRRISVVVVVGTLVAVGVGALRPKHVQISGALVRTTMQSTVGVVLDEIPPSMRARVATAIAAKPETFWKDRAAQQIRLTTYRLVFREAFYPASEGALQLRKQLPLPPEPRWDIGLLGPPSLKQIDGHDVVAVDYRFASVLLTDRASPGTSEPTLSSVGGVWREPFMFPVDPELVMQRTGYACMDEEEFPFASVDSEEVDSFYDQDCEDEQGLSNKGQCHFTKRPMLSCVEAVKQRVGRVDTTMTFTRLAWDRAQADRFRYGEVTGDAPDLQIYRPDFVASRVTYRYMHPSSCELVERSAGATGWRRLLQFATSDENVGNKALTIGGVDYSITGHAKELEAHHLYEFSACHKHYHFKYYGAFKLQGNTRVLNAKSGFCLQSTARTANREQSPLHNPFGGCSYQGVEAGWADQYKAGLSGQWLDTTGFPAGKATRSFTSNPNGYLCEGTFLDANGRTLGANQPVVWARTGLVTDDGKPVEAPRCALSSSWSKNNTDEADAVIPPYGEGLITSPCARGQIGPLRNCGFTNASMNVSCVPGARTTATFSIPKDVAGQVVRITDFSHALDSPIPARYEDSYIPLTPGVADQPSMLASAVVLPSSPATVAFTCPAARKGDATEPGGTYSVYTAPVFTDDAGVPLTRG